MAENCCLEVTCIGVINKIKLLSRFEDNSLEVFLITSTNILSSKVDISDLFKHTKLRKPDNVDNLKLLKLSLSTNDGEFKYKLADNTLKILRNLEGVTILLVSLPFREVDFQDLSLFCMECIKLSNVYRDKYKTFERECERLEHENSLLEQKLENFISVKSTETENLYCKFLSLLNAKKARIQYLTSLLESKTQSSDENRTNKRSIEQISDSEASQSESEFNKDTEESDFESEDSSKTSVQDDISKKDQTNPETSASTCMPLAKRLKKQLEERIESSDDSEPLNFNTQDIMDRL